MVKTRNKNTIYDDVRSLTIHGVSRIISARSISARLLWLACCAVALGYFIFYAVVIIRKHYSYEIYTKEYKILREKMSLPAITFCNTNYDEPNNDDFAVFQYFPQNCSILDRLHFANERNRRYFQIGCEMFLSNYSEISAQMRTYMSEMFKFPKFFSFLPYLQPCFTLNRNSSLVQYMSGDRNGLSMLLYFNQLEYAAYSGQVGILNDVRQGITVRIHDPKEHFSESGSINLPAGYHTHIALKKNVQRRKMKPFPSKCFDDINNKYGGIVPGKYNVGNCYFSCIYLALYDICKVVMSFTRTFMPPDKYPSRNLTTAELKQCYAKLAPKALHRTCDCRLPCYEETYEAKVIREPWPQRWQATDLLASFGDGLKGSSGEKAETTIRQHLIRLSIYYEELVENVREEKELYQKSSILSDMGGQMGLFLGASVLSVVEVFWVIMKLIKFWLLARPVKNFEERDIQVQHLQQQAKKEKLDIECFE